MLLHEHSIIETLFSYSLITTHKLHYLIYLALLVRLFQNLAFFIPRCLRLLVVLYKNNIIIRYRKLFRQYTRRALFFVYLRLLFGGLIPLISHITLPVYFI